MVILQVVFVNDNCVVAILNFDFVVVFVIVLVVVVVVVVVVVFAAFVDVVPSGFPSMP